MADNIGKREKHLRAATKRKRIHRTAENRKPNKLQISLIADVILKFENSALLRLLVILSIPAALYSLWLQNAEVSAGNLGRSWSNLTTQSSGNSGKVAALEHLSREVGELPYLDLSCKAMGGLDTLPSGDTVCTRPTYLAGLDLFEESYFSYSTAFLLGSNFSETEIQFADFSHGHLDQVSFNNASMMATKFFSASLADAVLDQANLVNSNFSYATAERATFRKANLLSAIFYAAYLPDADFSGANVSHTYFLSANIAGAKFDSAWAWADMPPKGIPPVDLCMFDSAVHSRWDKPDKCVPPQSKVAELPPISLTSPIEESDCSFIEGLRLLLMEMTNGMTQLVCWKKNPSYTQAWISGRITTKEPTLRFDQLFEHN